MTMQPCGTRAAYMRHWRNGEEACDPCKDAAAGGPPKRPRQSKTSNVETRKYDEVIAENPPQIVWRKNRYGIFRAVSVRDPHAETKTQREWGDRMAREEAALAALEEEAREVAERFRKHRADNSPFMAAARTEI